MLTRLQVKGFKNLLDVDVRFGPFTCVAGRNAVGKSNLFDAIRFLHLLTRHPIMEAVKLVRETKGRAPDPRSLFTSFGDFVAPEIRFVADLLVDREVQDDLGVPAKAAITSLRYTLPYASPAARGWIGSSWQRSRSNRSASKRHARISGFPPRDTSRKA
jgi:hypothetical protein